MNNTVTQLTKISLTLKNMEYRTCRYSLASCFNATCIFLTSRVVWDRARSRTSGCKTCKAFKKDSASSVSNGRSFEITQTINLLMSSSCRRLFNALKGAFEHLLRCSLRLLVLPLLWIRDLRKISAASIWLSNFAYSQYLHSCFDLPSSRTVALKLSYTNALGRWAAGVRGSWTSEVEDGTGLGR